MKIPTDFKYLLTYGMYLDVYAFENCRIIIDNRTGEQIFGYQTKKKEVGDGELPIPLEA